MTTIQINSGKIRNSLISFFKKANRFYVKLNQSLHFFWSWYVNKQTDNKINIALRKLINDPATILLLNTILFFTAHLLIGFFFGRTGIVPVSLMYLSAFNIAMFLVNVLKK